MSETKDIQICSDLQNTSASKRLSKIGIIDHFQFQIILFFEFLCKPSKQGKICLKLIVVFLISFSEV